MHSENDFPSNLCWCGENGGTASNKSKHSSCTTRFCKHWLHPQWMLNRPNYRYIHIQAIFSPPALRFRLVGAPNNSLAFIKCTLFDVLKSHHEQTLSYGPFLSFTQTLCVCCVQSVLITCFVIFSRCVNLKRLKRGQNGRQGWQRRVSQVKEKADRKKEKGTNQVQWIESEAHLYWNLFHRLL